MVSQRFLFKKKTQRYNQVLLRFTLSERVHTLYHEQTRPVALRSDQNTNHMSFAMSYIKILKCHDCLGQLIHMFQFTMYKEILFSTSWGDIQLGREASEYEVGEHPITTLASPAFDFQNGQRKYSTRQCVWLLHLSTCSQCLEPHQVLCICECVPTVCVCLVAFRFELSLNQFTLLQRRHPTGLIDVDGN